MNINGWKRGNKVEAGVAATGQTRGPVAEVGVHAYVLTLQETVVSVTQKIDSDDDDDTSHRMASGVVVMLGTSATKPSATIRTNAFDESLNRHRVLRTVGWIDTILAVCLCSVIVCQSSMEKTMRVPSE